MRNRLLGSERSAWNGPRSWLGSESSSTVGDFQVEDRLTQFQTCEAGASSLFDPGDFLLQGGVCRVHTLRGYLRPDGNDISLRGCKLEHAFSRACDDNVRVRFLGVSGGAVSQGEREVRAVEGHRSL